MNLNELSKQIELAQVNNEFGFGETIEYNRLNTVELPVTVQSFVSYPEQSEIETKRSDKIIADHISFRSVELVSPPIQGDKITYDGNIWYVQRWSNNNPYDIECTRNKTHVGSRVSRKLK